MRLTPCPADYWLASAPQYGLETDVNDDDDDSGVGEVRKTRKNTFRRLVASFQMAISLLPERKQVNVGEEKKGEKYCFSFPSPESQ